MKHKTLLSLVFALLVSSLVSACAASGPAPESVTAMVGGEYYTQFTLRYEKDWKSTNYGVGTVLPINSKVTLVSASAGGASITLPSGASLKLTNIEKYTGGVDVMMKKLLASTPANYESSAFKTDIEAGNMRIGMTKAEVLMARGYPPTHRTPNTDVDLWVYQQNRFVTQSVRFQDGKLVEARGVY